MPFPGEHGTFPIGHAVELIASDQFGDDGPQYGAQGIIISGSYDEYEMWYQVLFKGFPDSYYSVADCMIESL